MTKRQIVLRVIGAALVVAAIWWMGWGVEHLDGWTAMPLTMTGFLSLGMTGGACVAWSMFID